MKLALVSAVLFAFTGVTAGAAETICKSGEDVRKIEIVYKEAGKQAPCEVTYTKAGQSKLIFSANNEAEYCVTKVKAFAEKLSGLGFKCEEKAP